MEFRKEKSEKSKQLIKKQLESDIFNIRTGYYKKEKILPVSPKPNEYRQNIKEFVPKYKELKHYERNFINLLSDQQKHNPKIVDLKPNHNLKNNELEIIRNRSNEVKKNCYDKNGKFSAKKLYLYDVFKKEEEEEDNNNNENKTVNKSKINRSNSKSIKEKRNESNKNFFNKKILLKKKPKNLDIDYINNGDKIHNINNTYNKYYYITQHNNKNTKNLKEISSYQKKENLNIINWTINPYDNNYTRKNNYNMENKKLYKEKSVPQKDKNIKSEKIFYGHPKGLTKVFSTESVNPKKNIIKKINKRDTEEQEFFNILIKNVEVDRNALSIDDKKLKEIFYKNGLHLYDFNEDGLNDLFINKSIEAKLRKNKNDENFDRNYKKVVKELTKYNIRLDKKEMLDGKGFKNQNSVKKRKGTPGVALYKNKEKKDDTNDLNIGFYKEK